MPFTAAEIHDAGVSALMLTSMADRVPSRRSLDNYRYCPPSKSYIDIAVIYGNEMMDYDSAQQYCEHLKAAFTPAVRVRLERREYDRGIYLCGVIKGNIRKGRHAERLARRADRQMRKWRRVHRSAVIALPDGTVPWAVPLKHRKPIPLSRPSILEPKTITAPKAAKRSPPRKRRNKALEDAAWKRECKKWHASEYGRQVTAQLAKFDERAAQIRASKPRLTAPHFTEIGRCFRAQQARQDELDERASEVRSVNADRMRAARLSVHQQPSNCESHKWADTWLDLDFSSDPRELIDADAELDVASRLSEAERHRRAEVRRRIEAYHEQCDVYAS